MTIESAVPRDYKGATCQYTTRVYSLIAHMSSYIFDRKFADFMTNKLIVLQTLVWWIIKLYFVVVKVFIFVKQHLWICIIKEM
jgi:hypothetical protein